jgi:hypothetical protein
MMPVLMMSAINIHNKYFNLREINGKWKMEKWKKEDLQGEQDRVSFGLEANSSASLLDCLHCILNLVDPALRTPHRDVVVVLIPELLLHHIIQSSL